MTTLLTTLQFEETNLSIIDHDSQPWLSSGDIAKALGYKRADSVSRIYDRSSDEFTDDMTQTVNLTVSGNLQKTVRIFSPRGCHLIAMLSHTKRAKMFRRWVLDVLEEHKSPQTKSAPPAITADALTPLKHRIEELNKTMISIFAQKIVDESEADEAKKKLLADGGMIAKVRTKDGSVHNPATAEQVGKLIGMVNQMVSGGDQNSSVFASMQAEIDALRSENHGLRIKIGQAKKNLDLPKKLAPRLLSA